MKQSFQVKIACGIALYSIAATCPVLAQIIPDATLPNNSTVTSQGGTNIISGGTKAGNNLFHSFQHFSVPTGGTAYFNNALNFDHIISRVTGSSISNIDGLIRANGTANLILINPNGFIVGRNASLNIGGSFLASTASSLKFADGIYFSASASPTKPLLAISVPIGLQFGPNPGRILVQGNGQGLRTRENPDLIDTTAGLHVASNQTLALVGGNIDLDGATIKTAGGVIALGSVDSNSLVNLIPINKGWTLDYQGVQNFQDIKLFHQAAVDASGAGAGDIHVQGRKVSIWGGSQIETSTLGAAVGGTLAVRASDTVELSGTSADGQFFSGLVAGVYSTATGSGGNVSISANRLSASDGAKVYIFTSGPGNGGSLYVNASNSVELQGTSADGGYFSGLFVRSEAGATGAAGNLGITTGKLTASNGAEVSSATFGPGAAGNLTIDADRLLVSDGAQVDTGTFGTGNAGTLYVNASNSVEVMGTSADGNYSSGLFTSVEPGATGAAGNLTIITGKLIASNGGQIATSTLGPRNAGRLFVMALNSVELSGGSAAGEFLSGIFTSTYSAGAAGNSIITTKDLIISDGAKVSAGTSGEGNGGNIQINSSNFRLLDGATVTSVARKSGNGGDITVNSNNFEANSGGQILTTTFGAGKAGNITLHVPNSLILSGSDPHYQ